MKSTIVFFAVLAIASAQFFNQPAARRPAQFSRPPSPPRPAFAPQPAPAPARPLAAKVSSNDATANIVRYDNDVNPDGSYSYAFETDNGIAAQETGTPRDFGGNPPVIPDVAQGSFSWVAPNGEQIAITYIADENGYQPQGSAIPTPPPIPEQILRALQYIEKNPQRN